jgi:parallel beta-helix repeat protein
MRLAGCACISLLSFLANPASAANSVADFFPNCTAPPVTSERSLVVDPKGGANTYRDIDSALRAAKPGDTIELRTGNYGDLLLSGSNSKFISIVAAPGQSPRFDRISVGGAKPASHWRLSGLTVSSMSAPRDNKWTHDKLILVLNSDNIVVENNILSSDDDAMHWAPEDPGAPVVDAPSDGISARQSTCISIANNKLRNVFNGIDFGGDQVGNRGKYYLVSGNAITDFAGDGIDHFASHSRISNNRITDGHDICHHTCIHNDGIQGWNYNNNSAFSNNDVIINGNTIIAQVTPDITLPVIGLQGITIFNGKWDDVHITNNVIITNTWHGISIYGVNNSTITNNTVASTDPKYFIWIMVNGQKSDPPGMKYNVIVRNNVVPRITGTPNLGTTADHNLFLKTAADFADAFVEFEPGKFKFDMRPSRRSPVIGKGARESAPSVDIEGHPRQKSIDIGAYAYSTE